MWQSSDDGCSASANLPFGICRLDISDQSEDGCLLKVRFSIHISKSVRLHAVENRYKTTFARVEKVWVPHLRPKKDLVIADRIFRSPAIVLVKDLTAIALIPDVLNLPQGIKSYLDFIRHDPGGNALISHGIGHWKTSGHIFFKRSKTLTSLSPGTEFSINHFLMLMPETGEDHLKQVSSFLWKKFSRRNNVMPQVLPFAQYERLAKDRIFAPDLYREFNYQGKKVAGCITQTTTSRRKPKVMDSKGVKFFLDHQSKLMAIFHFTLSHVITNQYTHKLLTQFLHAGFLSILPMASFQAWFNEARTALGAYLHSQRVGCAQTAQKSDMIIELALSAPQESGCFPSICMFPEDKVFWIRGTRAFELIDSFHVPDAAVTGFHLLEWYEMARQDPRIMERCQKLARFFIELQDSEGAIPAWVKPGPRGYIIDKSLARSASSAAPAMFLARLYRIAPDPSLLSAAKAALEFINRNVIPEEKWFDFELFYSCAGRPTGSEGPDPFTGCFPANTLSIYWATRAYLDLHLKTGEMEYLKQSRRFISRLNMFQQVFDHPQASMDTFGGFSVMNADGEFNDARQGLFVPLYLDMYKATREPEMFERAIAALRACFTTMLVEDHYAIAPGNMKNFRPSDRGSILENYGHTGRDEVTSGYLSPDWGCGTSLYASGYAFRNFGQLYVDVKNAIAFGVDQILVRHMSIRDENVIIETEEGDHAKLEIVLDDPDNQVQRVIVNQIQADKMGEKENRFLVQFQQNRAFLRP